MKYFLDTNMCIYYLKGRHPEIYEKILSKNPDDIKIASIVKAELLYGVEKSDNKETNNEKVSEFLLPFEIIDFNNAAAIEYSRIRAGLEREGKIIGPNDLIISATVLANDGILITNNAREFKRVDKLKIENWIN